MCLSTVHKKDLLKDFKVYCRKNSITHIQCRKSILVNRKNKFLVNVKSKYVRAFIFKKGLNKNKGPQETISNKYKTGFHSHFFSI